MIIALAGRRVSPPSDPKPRFPESRVGAVGSEIERLLLEAGATALVGSGARGADLLAMSAAGRLGLERWMVLPFDPETFRASSVEDGKETFQHDWGRDFADVVDDLTPTAGGGTRDRPVRGGLVVLRLPAEGEHQAAYDAVNDAILDEAGRLARGGRDPDGRALAVVVWDGEKRGEDDLTWSFQQKAQARGLPVRVVLTAQDRSPPS